MKTTGIICEYNPFHLGHKKQLSAVRAKDPDSGIVCLMSGNYVQRGAPAIFDKALRSKAAVLCGADLVLELPVTTALSSAEGFASGGVKILSQFCDELSFGAEQADGTAFMELAKALLSEKFSAMLQPELEKGLCFPAARQAALTNMGLDGSVLTLPNNILAVEYCKAIVSQSSRMKPCPIARQGAYHSTEPDEDNPSATAIRGLIETDSDWAAYVPAEAAACFDGAAVHSLKHGEDAILYCLRTMSDAEFENLPYGSEGLWRKLMHASRKYATLDQIIAATKSKRYTRTRIDRMILCAFLGISRDMIEASPPYARALAFNDRGREILRHARNTGDFPNIGQRQEHPYQQLEDRCGALYGLFSQHKETPDLEKNYRVFLK